MSLLYINEPNKVYRRSSIYECLLLEFDSLGYLLLCRQFFSFLFNIECLCTPLEIFIVNSNAMTSDLPVVRVKINH